MPLTQRTIRALSVRLPSARASVRRASTDDLFWCVAGASTSASTLERVGVYLKTACFTHGQLYVAASRVGNAQHLKFALDRDADHSTAPTARQTLSGARAA